MDQTILISILHYCRNNIYKTILRHLVCFFLISSFWFLVSGFSIKRKLYSHRRALFVCISLSNFVIGQRCRTIWTISLYLKSFVNEIFVIHLRKNPYHWFHKILRHCEIGMFNIYPTSQMIDKSFPIVIDLHDCSSTCFDKRLHTNLLLYLFPSLNTELLLYVIFCRQAMTIPSSFTCYMIPTHRHISWNNIFQGRC